MAEIRVYKLVYLLHLSCALIDVTFSGGYENYSLDSEKICHPYNKETIHVTDLALLVRPHHIFDTWNVINDKTCKFAIHTKKNIGLFAVIQKMSFRRNGTKCLDYVEFKSHNATRYCGQLDRRKMRYYPVPEENIDSNEHISAGTYAEFDTKSQLETRIFISKKRLLPNETLDLVIVYTPYKDCRKVDPDEYRSINANFCIRSEYFCDGYQNCVTNTCIDENCQVPESVSNNTGTKVTVGTVSAIFLTFITFAICLWICRRHKKFCWSSDCAGPSVHTADYIATSHGESAGTDNVPVSTAPMLEVIVPAPVQDKDLPPSYDSLFPEQSTPTNT
ncbi:uncharacterized protein LOC105701049 [Orussus abietinus]|uniref:uncharacterized protein LOC105701049 n=1 Tax=Orussus abietinus TaxID=222816 RepID=UPI0006253227|nr:uncharacterized protein LOC105701049 [Orussus abietinus]